MTWADFFRYFPFPIAATLVAGLVCPLVGAFLLVRRTGFYGVALPQLAAAGVACGFAAMPVLEAWTGLDLGADEMASGEHSALNIHLFWAALFTFGGLGALSLARERGTETARVAATFALASAATVLFANASPVGGHYVNELLRGEILAIGLHEFDTLAIVLGVSAALLFVLRRDLTLIGYDGDQARVLGLPVRRFELILHGATGAVVATGVMTVGPVVLFGLLVIPPLAARAIARSMAGFLRWSALLGLASGALGLVLSKEFDWPLGPAVVVAGTAFWAACRLRTATRGGSVIPRRSSAESRP